MKVLEENIGQKISDIPCSNIFHQYTPQSKGHKGKNKQVGLHQNKKLLHAKQNINKMKREPTIWENIFANNTLDKGLISKIYKEVTRPHTRKTNNPIKKWAKDLNRHFSKEDIQRAQRQVKRCSASLVIREMLVEIRRLFLILIT